MDSVDIIVGVDGSVSFIHDDDVAELFDAQQTTTRRASHVEPVANGWDADMSPVGGPASLSRALGLSGPFRRRADALEAEVAWLREHMASGEVQA